MILGLNYSSYHDTAAVLLGRNNDIIYAASEERYSREKKDGRFPIKIIENNYLDSIEAVAIPYNKKPSRRIKKNNFFNDLLFKSIYQGASYPKFWLNDLKKLNKPLYFYDHHLSHAVAGIYLSGYSDSNILVSDFSADNTKIHTAIYYFNKNNNNLIKRVEEATTLDYSPICSIYTFITALISLKPNEHEGKLTGLAAFGKTTPYLERKIIRTFLTNDLVSNVFMWNDRFNESIPPNIRVNDNIRKQIRNLFKNYKDEDLAAAAQNIIENITLKIVKKIFSKYKKSKNLILSGGLFANVKLNYEVSNIVTGKLFVSPPMGDEGNALGAALLYNFKSHNKSFYNPKKIDNLYYGLPNIKNSKILKQKFNIPFISHKSNLESIVQTLTLRKTVAISKGLMEFGPRALGNRSILHECSDKNINSNLNKQLKRTEYMPFAPLIRIENAEKYFYINDSVNDFRATNFMTICLRVKPEFKKLCPAVVHIDNTARPQFLSAQSNKFLYDILYLYEKKTGLPALINTSFNMHEEPIVNDEISSLLAFIRSKIDLLVLGNDLIFYEENRDIFNFINSFDEYFSPKKNIEKYMHKNLQNQFSNILQDNKKLSLLYEQQLNINKQIINSKTWKALDYVRKLKK